jgi:Ankyrin repeats (many copies)
VIGAVVGRYHDQVKSLALDGAKIQVKNSVLLSSIAGTPMAQSVSTLMSQISKKHRDVVQKIFKHGGANLSRDEFFQQAKKKSMAEPAVYSTADSWYADRLDNVKTLHGCTDEEAEAMVVAEFYDSDLTARGVARRIMSDDPGELEAALSLQARFDWLNTCYPSRQSGESYPDVWMALKGLAAGDIDIARAIFRTRCHDSNRGHKPTLLIYDAVEAIVMNDRPAQARLVPKIASCKVPDSYRAILEALQGIIEADSSIVAGGLERVLATFRRGQDLLDHETIISFNAHALAELAHWVSPGMLAKFDVDRDLPWDRGYYHWLRRQPRSTAYRDLSDYSSLLNRWVHDLEEPAWWRRKRGSAAKTQSTPGSATVSEDASSEESEGVPLPTDCAPAFLMIRAAAPARRNKAWHALECCDIGRTKMESYRGSAEEMIPWLNQDWFKDWMRSNIRPSLLSVRFKGERWIHCIESRAGLVSVERLASNKDLQVVSAGFEPQENRTVARYYQKGSIAAELVTAGKGGDALEVLSFQSSVTTKAFLKRCQTVRQAIDGFFAAFDAKARELGVLESKGGLRLLNLDGRAVRANELEELAITFYVPLTAADSPATARLCAAIRTGDVAAARQAIADGASLEFVPDSMGSPLSMATYECDPGDLRGVAKLLVEAGAPIDGYDREDPPICQAIGPLIQTEESIIRRLQAILSLGADINAPARHASDQGFPPLHLAIRRTCPQVVRFLLEQGADLEARNENGQTALELAEFAAREDPERKFADGADDEAAAGEEGSHRPTPPETVTSLLSFMPEDTARRRVQIVRLLREITAKR